MLLLAGGCSSGGDDPEPTPTTPVTPSQTLEINTSSATSTFGAEGGTTQITLTASSSWTADVTATRTVDWCSVSPTSGAAGTATLTITTQPNTTYDERNATVTIKSGTLARTFTLTQKQQDAMLLTADKVEISAEGGETSVEVKSNISYTYEVEESAQSWIQHTTTRALTSHQEVFTVSANTSTQKREGKITFTGGGRSETVTVYQAAETPTLVLTQNEYDVPSEGQTLQVELKSNLDYEVQMPDVDWIEESQSRAISTHTHYFTVHANPTYDARSAQITFVNAETGLSEKVIVRQVQKDALIVAQKEYTVEAAGGALDFAVQANVDYEVTTSADWIEQVTSRGLTEKTLRFTVKANESNDSRTGKITVSCGSLAQEITVVQAGQYDLLLSQSEFSIVPGGETIQVTVSTNLDYEVTVSDSWVKEVTTRGLSDYTHTFEVAANTTYDSRQATITFKSKTQNITKTVTLTQAQLDAIVVAEKEYSYAAAGGTLDLKVQANVDYEVTTSADWIEQVTSRGLTEKTLRFTVKANDSNDNRTGTITVSNGNIVQEIKVMQAGQYDILLSQSEFSVVADGETIQVVVSSNLDYMTTISDDWVKEVGTRALADKTYSFEVSPNLTYDSRTATITFQSITGDVSKTLTITQAQRNALVVADKEYSFESEGGSLDLKVQANVDYEVATSADWIEQVTSRGLTEKTLRFTVKANESNDSRTGKITVSCGSLAQEITVVQAGQYDLLLSQSEFSIVPGGETIQVTVSTNLDYEVTVSDSWVKEVTTRGLSDYTHTFEVAANTTYDSRQATITFKSKTRNITKTVTLKQAQLDALVVADKEYSFESEGGSLDLKVQANVDYEVTTSADWIEQVTSRGLTEKTLRFTVKANESNDSRTGKITVSCGSLAQEITVVQAGQYDLLLSQSEFSIVPGGETIQVTVSTNLDYEVTVSDSWVKEVTTRGLSDYTHTFEVAANTTYDSRQATITFKSKTQNITKTVTLTQAQLDAIVVAEKEYSYAAAGGTLDLKVQANVDYEVTTSADWIEQVTSRGLTEKTLRFTVKANDSYNSRTGKITVSSGSLAQEITVVQAGQYDLLLSQSEFSIVPGGETIQVTVSTNLDYEVTVSDSWVKEVTTRGLSDYTHTFEVAANTTYDSRQATITFKSKTQNITKTVTLTQAQLDAIVVAEKEYSYAAAGGTLDLKVQANVDYEVATSADWIEQVTSRGLTEKTLRFTVKENTTEDARSAVITLKNSNQKQEVKVTQAGKRITTSGGGVDDMPIQKW
jgi:hypothetical protein